MDSSMKWLKNTKGSPFTGIGSLEADILAVVWERKQLTVRDVYETLREQRQIAYTTVMTVMNNLVKKALLTQDRTAIAYAYTPAIPGNEVAGTIMDSVVQRLFRGRPTSRSPTCSALSAISTRRRPRSCANTPRSISPPDTERGGGRKRGQSRRARELGKRPGSGSGPVAWASARHSPQETGDTSTGEARLDTALGVVGQPHSGRAFVVERMAPGIERQTAAAHCSIKAKAVSESARRPASAASTCASRNAVSPTAPSATRAVVKRASAAS